jgi:hypothetical protein
MLQYGYTMTEWLDSRDEKLSSIYYFLRDLRDIVDVGKKYMLPQLCSVSLVGLEIFLGDVCNNAEFWHETESGSVRSCVAWHIAVMLAEAESWEPIELFVKVMQKEAAWIASNVSEDLMQDGLTNCPRLATAIAMSGGLDGKGLRLRRNMLGSDVLPAELAKSAL